jgi:hypothetical protein
VTGRGLAPRPGGGDTDVLATYQYPLLDLFWTMFMLFAFVIWIWILIAIFSDIFRSHDMGGVGKTLWVLFVLFIPFLGVIVYLIARGHGMQERNLNQAKQQQQAFDQYVKETASAANPAEQLEKLAALKDQGVLSQAEFDAQKAKLLA